MGRRAMQRRCATYVGLFCCMLALAASMEEADGVTALTDMAEEIAMVAKGHGDLGEGKCPPPVPLDRMHKCNIVSA